MPLAAGCRGGLSDGATFGTAPLPPLSRSARRERWRSAGGLVIVLCCCSRLVAYMRALVVQQARAQLWGSDASYGTNGAAPGRARAGLKGVCAALAGAGVGLPVPERQRAQRMTHFDCTPVRKGGAKRASGCAPALVQDKPCLLQLLCVSTSQVAQMSLDNLWIAGLRHVHMTGIVCSSCHECMCHKMLS